MDDLTVLRSFDSLEAAAAAVNQLVQAGFAHGAIELRVLETEAGPAEGNFVVGCGKAVSRSAQLVIVDVHSEAEHRSATEVLDRAGGRAVQDIANAALQRA